MVSWTPPEIIDLSQNSTGFTSPGQWRLDRDDTTAAPLTLTRPDGVSLTIDFSSGKARHRTTESGMGAQPMSRALGLKAFYRQHGSYPTIIDATAGLGQDAWALASMGCDVVSFERHPVVHALLADGLSRALNHSECAVIAQRIRLIHGEAHRETHHPLIQSAQAVYLDPMYPERRKKASSKKGMQFLHALLGPPQGDDEALLMWAVRSGVNRVAVKRPKGAPQLAGSEHFAGQQTVVDSPNTRYDIYHCQS